jgi:CHASE2 domain-containing sensor protein
MKKIYLGLLIGALAGIIDVIPMWLQKLSWDANLSAFVMWLVVGFLVPTVDLKVGSVAKGILIAFVVLSPTAIIIGAKEPISLIPILIMTLILGSGVGYFGGKIGS